MWRLGWEGTRRTTRLGVRSGREMEGRDGMEGRVTPPGRETLGRPGMSGRLTPGRVTLGRLGISGRVTPPGRVTLGRDGISGRVTDGRDGVLGRVTDGRVTLGRLGTSGRLTLGREGVLGRVTEGRVTLGRLGPSGRLTLGRVTEGRDGALGRLTLGREGSGEGRETDGRAGAEGRSEDGRPDPPPDPRSLPSPPRWACEASGNPAMHIAKKATVPKPRFRKNGLCFIHVFGRRGSGVIHFYRKMDIFTWELKHSVPWQPDPSTTDYPMKAQGFSDQGRI